ncbi:MAG TPA: protein-glutamate O-methyltransferase CheR [Cyclobacteriaceae bacterium]|nr:protein-glutamate O-methyltransferase CheR [Cyclobacteriaceae bacterium]
MITEPSFEISDEEIEVILHDVVELYGYDFTNYSRASMRRRITRLIVKDRFTSFAEFRYRVRSDKAYFKRFVEEITVNVTEMFRDPLFYKSLRETVLPMLAPLPMIRVWHAGCSTGEEVYSMAILLQEAGLLRKSLLYATDINPSVLEKVRYGVYPISQMKQYSENYILSGGKHDFSAYYTAKYNSVKFDELLSKRIVLATHNLVADRSFNEFQLILCRNVMIYFDKPFQDRVLRLFYESLEMLGYLALGSKETLKFTDISKKFKQLENKEKIWRKIS